MSVCVCLSVHEDICRTTCVIFTKFLGLLFLIDLIKWVSNICPSGSTSVHPQKVSSILMEFDV